MQIQSRDEGPVTVLSVEGDLVLGEPESQFKRTVSQLIEQGRINLLIDLNRVRYLDSSGLGALVRALADTQKEGGQTKLLRVGERIRKLLDITKLGSVFEMYDDEEQALSTF